MKNRLLILAVSSAAAVLGAPVIQDVQNAASNVPTGLPNAGIAQGAMFVIKGTGLGPASVALATSFPLATSIGGSSVKVTVGGQTRDAIMYYSLDRQVAAILPSNTPTGTGTVTVTYNNETSATSPITVVDRNVALYTLDSSGSGPAVATFAASFVTPTTAAKSGDIVILWANGLGAVSGDETRPANQTDLSIAGLEVWVGGKQAEVLFRGRNNCCSSVDTIYIRVPSDLAGCSVPVTVRIGNFVSNTATIPVASSGNVCTPANTSISQGDVERILAKGNFTFGSIGLSRSTVTVQGPSIPGVPATTTTSKSEGGTAVFAKVTANLNTALSSNIDQVSYGACTVTSFTGQANPNPVGSVGFETLDAGASVNISGPNGQRSLAKQSALGITGYFSDFNEGYLSAGSYTASAPGGSGVPSFSTAITMPAPLTWTNRTELTTVNRSAGATVTWTGGDANGTVQIVGGSSLLLAQNRFVSTSFLCQARASEGRFTVPAVVLLALPASGGQTIGGITISQPGSMSISSYVNRQFSIPNFDFAAISASDTVGQSVTYR